MGYVYCPVRLVVVEVSVFHLSLKHAIQQLTALLLVPD